MVFVLEAIKDRAEKLMLEIGMACLDAEPLYKDVDFWTHIIDLLEVEISELPDPPEY